MEFFEHNETTIRHSSMAYGQGGRPIDLGLKGKDVIDCCEGDLPCDHKKFLFLRYICDIKFVTYVVWYVVHELIFIS